MPNIELYSGEVAAEEQRAVVRLLERVMTPHDARDALTRFSGGSSRRSIEWIVAATEREGSFSNSLRLPDDRLISLLVEVAGAELLTDREVRRIIADKCGADALEKLHDYPSETFGRAGHRSKVNAVAQRKWHPGKSWAAHFVRTVGLPLVFAGTRGDKAPPDMLVVEPFAPLPELADFQGELFDQVLEVLNGREEQNRAILTLPTGAGKTRTTVEALLAWWRERTDRSIILWIAQSEELCEQAVQAFREVWIDLGHREDAARDALTIGRLWGDRDAVPLDCGVVVASIQKLHAAARGDGRDLRVEDLGILGDSTGVVVIDEAHRSLAPSYSTVLGTLGINFRRKGAATALLGLTATPRRTSPAETVRLHRRFHDQILTAPSLGSDPVMSLRNRHVLATVQVESLNYDAPQLDLSRTPKYAGYYESFEDIHPQLLQQLGEEHRRNRCLIERMLELDPDWPVLLFACSVQHAQAMASILQRNRRSAACVTGTTRTPTRRGLIERFRERELSVLCNYGVLTTGFDAPSVRCVVVARPTASPILYEQMIGRGMRGPKFGGTEECLVIDVDDNLQWRNMPAAVEYSSLEQEMRYAR